MIFFFFFSSSFFLLHSYWGPKVVQHDHGHLGKQAQSPITFAMHEVTELLPHCPWAHWQRPNIKWCEENICAVITTPAIPGATWCIFLSVFTIFYEGARNYERERRKKAWTIRTMGIAAIICGLCSFSYHASYTKFFQFFDYLGMYVYIAVPITLNFRRLQIFTKHQQYWVAFIAIVVEIITYIADVFKIKIQFIMALNIFWHCR